MLRQLLAQSQFSWGAAMLQVHSHGVILNIHGMVLIPKSFQGKKETMMETKRDNSKTKINPESSQLELLLVIASRFSSYSVLNIACIKYDVKPYFNALCKFCNSNRKHVIN